MNYNVRRKLDKRDLLSLCGLSLIVYCWAIYFSPDKIFTSVVIAVAVIVFLISAVCINHKKTLNDKMVNLTGGISGLITSFSLAFLFSVHIGASILQKIVVLVIMLVIIICIMIYLKNYYAKKQGQNHSQAKTISAGVISVFATAGVLISRFLMTNNVNIYYELSTGVMSLIFAMYYIFILQSKDKSREKQNN